MGYENANIASLLTQLSNTKNKLNDAETSCFNWQSVNNCVTMTIAQASGLTADIQGYMSSMFTAYDALSGTYAGF